MNTFLITVFITASVLQIFYANFYGVKCLVAHFRNFKNQSLICSEESEKYKQSLIADLENKIALKVMKTKSKPKLS
jgi:hypothetical protein